MQGEPVGPLAGQQAEVGSRDVVALAEGLAEADPALQQRAQGRRLVLHTGAMQRDQEHVGARRPQPQRGEEDPDRGQHDQEQEAVEWKPVGLAVGRGRAKRGIANNGGVAIAGIVLGGLAIVVGLAFIAIWTTVWKDVRGGDYIDCMQKAGSNNVEQQQCANQFRRTVQDRLSVTLTPAQNR